MLSCFVINIMTHTAERAVSSRETIFDKGVVRFSLAKEAERRVSFLRHRVG